VHTQLQFEQGGRKLLRGSKHLSSFAGSELEPFWPNLFAGLSGKGGLWDLPTSQKR